MVGDRKILDSDWSIGGGADFAGFWGRLASGWGSVWADKAAGQGLTKLLDKEKMGEEEMKRMR